MLANGIKQSATGAAGNLTVAVIGAYPPFSKKYAVGPNGDPIPYGITRDSDGVGVEWGWGHLADNSTFVRDIILATWNGTNYVEAPGATATDLTSGGPYTIGVEDNSSLRALPPIGTDPAIATTRHLMGGQWCGNAGINVGQAAGVASIVPFRLDMPVTCTGIGVAVTVAASTGTTKNMRAALYRQDKNGHIGNLIAETIALNTGTATTKLLTFTGGSGIHLDAGWYYVAILCDGNPSIAGSNSTASAGICPMWGVSGGNPGGRYVMATKTITYVDSGSCFPSPMGSSGITYAVDWAGSWPAPTLMVTS